MGTRSTPPPASRSSDGMLASIIADTQEAV